MLVSTRSRVCLQITKHTHPISLFDVLLSLSIQCRAKRKTFSTLVGSKFLHDSSIQERVLDDIQYGKEKKT